VAEHLRRHRQIECDYTRKSDESDPMWRHPFALWHFRHWRTSPARRTITAMQTIDIVIFDGFDEMDAVGPYEVFRNAGFDTALVTLDGAETVTASHGMTVKPHRVLGTPDAFLVPGGGWNDRSERGARAEAERGDLPRRLKELHDAGVTALSVCTGAMLLAAAGITDGRPAITHHVAIGDLRTSGAIVQEDARVVDDGDVVTSGGVTSGIDMALHLVERERGRAVADAVAREMEHRRDERVLQPHG
jgi:transcriptional regulator GlxA family with amidase domain